MEVTPGFKLTEVGMIPEDWQALSIGEMEAHGLVRLFRGKVISKKDINNHPGLFPIYSSSVHAGGLFGRYGLFMFDEELITWSIDGGGHFFHRPRHKFSVTNVCGYMRIDATRLSYRFFAGQLQQLHSRKLFDYQIKAHPSVIRGAYTVPFPPLPEQRAIAAVLSDVDALLDGLDRLIAKKRDLKQAAMQQLLTGQTRLPGFGGEWEVKRLGEIASIRNQKVMPSVIAPETACVELEHVASGDGRLVACSTAQYSTSSKYRFAAGDVLFGRLRPYLRKYWLADRDGICTTEIWPMMVFPCEAVSGFLFALVQSNAFIEAASVSYGTHMPRADWGVVSKFEVLVPALPEQTAIAAVLSDMDAELTALEARRDKTRALKQAMMQELLTGRTRLV